ncbi:DUF1365 domain-containing protein [Gordonia sp. HS-NH1]|uniref:DUF1365 domain-containing protein n=1 Tax=Gordonia sp. HS-NH1 TaxID=1435068 RepID=UPI0006E23BC4|nr:DUF1365 domain-containing protein [Gordonia sp. HS-NH1]
MSTAPTERPLSTTSTAPALPALVDAEIGHSRITPLRHAFTYRTTSWLIDLDTLPTLPRALRPFARFRPDDHFPEPATPGATLRDRLDAHLRGAGVEPPAGRVTALLSPRVAGYVFNPLSVFWCHDADGRLVYVVAEVHNTYGQRHCYVVHTDAAGRADVDKEFYVSPFNPVDGRYRLWLPEPAGRHVALSVTLERPGHRPFVASLSGTTTPATPRAVLSAQLRTPLAPIVVAARIRRHGIALWARRLPLVPRPDHPVSTTIALEEKVR